jgi:hypothetical protein
MHHNTKYGLLEISIHMKRVFTYKDIKVGKPTAGGFFCCHRRLYGSEKMYEKVGSPKTYLLNSSIFPSPFSDSDSDSDTKPTQVPAHSKKRTCGGGKECLNSHTVATESV